MAKDRSGQAFPMYDAGGQDARMIEGMTRRDYLAARAPEWPPMWFTKTFAFDEPDPGIGKGLEYFEWNERREKAAYFAWRVYYADMLIEELAK